MTLETAVNDSTAIMFTALKASSVGDGALCGEERLAAGRTGDTNLVLRIRAGDQSAFRELVERHQSRIFRVVYGILNHKADAEDVAQDVFAKVYFAIHRFDHRSALVTWIYRIAVNEAYSHLRKMRTRRRYEGDPTGDAAGGDLHSLIDQRPTPDRTAAQRDLLNKLLALIPEDDRLLLLGKEVEGCSITTLAEMTGMNESTIRVRLFRARRKLVELTARLAARPPAGGPECGPVGLDEDRS
jgi:RNA polymerase sigma-70 factor (ECF subfamily)